MNDILRELYGTDNINTLTDFYDGHKFYGPYTQGEISPDDVVLIYLMDSAQLFQHKALSCWIYIYILADLAPDK